MSRRGVRGRCTPPRAHRCYAEFQPGRDLAEMDAASLVHFRRNCNLPVPKEVVEGRKREIHQGEIEDGARSAEVSAEGARNDPQNDPQNDHQHDLSTNDQPEGAGLDNPSEAVENEQEEGAGASGGRSPSPEETTQKLQRLRLPYAPAPIEVACLEVTPLPPKSTTSPRSPIRTVPTSQEEEESWAAQVELELCLAAAEETAPPPSTGAVRKRRPTPPRKSRPPPQAVPIPTWSDIRANGKADQATTSGRNPRRQLQLEDYETAHLRRRTPSPPPILVKTSAPLAKDSRPTRPYTTTTAISDTASTTKSIASSHSRGNETVGRLTGVMFGGLRPVAFDADLDPPPGGCYNCWKKGHRRRECPEKRRSWAYCINCGRRGAEISECPRCAERYAYRQNHWESTGAATEATAGRGGVTAEQRASKAPRSRSSSRESSTGSDAQRRRRHSPPPPSRATPRPETSPEERLAQDINPAAIEVMRFTTRVLEETRSLPPDLRVTILRAVFRGETEGMGLGRTEMEGPRIRELSRAPPRKE